MSSISWGRRERYRFQATGTLHQCSPPPGAGVFAVTYRQDGEGRPKSHTVVFFGESADIAKQLPSIHDQMRQWWADYGGDASDLYLFVHPMPNSTSWERSRVQAQLVSEYDPRANH